MTNLTWVQGRQLKQLTVGGAAVSYTYDANGNQKKEVKQHVSVTVGGNTQVYNKETDYTYDLRGLLTGVSVKTPSANEITGEVTYDTQTTTNTYNAAGKRLKRVEEDKTTRFYYMGEALLFTTNQDLVMTSENVLNTGGQIIAGKRFAAPGVEVTDPFAGIDRYAIACLSIFIYTLSGSLISLYNQLSFLYDLL